jgi:hypothetical protein
MVEKSFKGVKMTIAKATSIQEAAGFKVSCCKI